MKVVMKRKPIKKALDRVEKSIAKKNKKLPEATTPIHRLVDIDTLNKLNIVNNPIGKDSGAGPIKSNKIVYPTVGVRFRCPYCIFHSKEKAIVAYHTKSNHTQEVELKAPVKQEMLVGLSKRKVGKEESTTRISNGMIQENEETIHGANENNELINSVISSEENEGKKTSEEAVQVVKSSTIEVLSFYTVSIFYFTYPRFVCFAINL